MIETKHVAGGAGALCRSLLSELPEWFGHPNANEDYVACAEKHSGVVASIAGEPVGLMTVIRHSQHSAEVYLMAVRRQHHRKGIGSVMLKSAEVQLVGAGVEFLQVKTLGQRNTDPQTGDAGYARTRAFYVACGFRVLEEHKTLWGPESPALQLVKVVGGFESAVRNPG